MVEIPKLSVVMPAYNEMATIEEILSRVQAIPIDKEIVVIDDGSTDGTRDFLTRLMDHIQSAGSASPATVAAYDRLTVPPSTTTE